MTKNNSMILLAAALAKGEKGEKHGFTFEHTAKLMVQVLKEGGQGKAKYYLRTHTAAEMAVHMQDEYQKAEKRHARPGFLMLLKYLERVCTVRVYQWDPEGNWLTRTFPDVAAKLATPDQVYFAQARMEISEEPERREKDEKKAAKKAAQPAVAAG